MEEVIVLVQVRSAFSYCHSSQVFIHVLPLVTLPCTMVVSDIQRHSAGGAGSVLFKPGAQAGTKDEQDSLSEFLGINKHKPNVQ